MNANDVLGGLVEKINGVDVYKKAEATQAAVNALPLLLEVAKASRDVAACIRGGREGLPVEFKPGGAGDALFAALARLDEGVRP